MLVKENDRDQNPSGYSTSSPWKEAGTKKKVQEKT